MRGASFRSLRGDQYHRSSVALRIVLRFKGADDYPFLGRNLGKFDDRAIVLLCHEQVTAPSATMRSLTCLAQEEWWRSRSPQRPRRHAHLPPPRSHPQHVWWGTQTLAAWEVASCARTAGGSPVTGRSERFLSPVTSTVVHGADKEWHIDRCCSSWVHKSACRIARWSDISTCPNLLMIEWVYEVPQVRSSAEPLPVISPFQINCKRSLQTSTGQEAKERTLTLDSILLPWTSNLRNVVADEQHENIRGDCIRNVSVCVWPRPAILATTCVSSAFSWRPHSSFLPGQTSTT